MANLARDPAMNAQAIFQLPTPTLYAPVLRQTPDGWTITVKVNDSGDDAQDQLIGGPGNLAFDADGYAWITNNVKQGGTTSNTNMIVLKPNGQPSDGSGGKPKSPVSGGGLLGGGFGITVDAQGNVWEGNFGWGGVNPSPDGNGSISEFTSAGVAISGDMGYQGGPVRVQGMAVDASGNIWICSFENDNVYVFLDGDPNNAVHYPQFAGSGPFDLAINPDGSVWVSNGLVGKKPSSLAKYELRNRRLHQNLILKPFGHQLRGLVADSLGNAWVTSQGESVLYAVAPDGTVLGKFGGGGINGPWGAIVDGDDNVWVANFGPLMAGTNFTNGRLSKLCGANTAACPPGSKTGDPLSPDSGYTVTSAGSQVLLHNGDPLYGPNAPPSFAPMMRQTGLQVDAAGNLWTLNNWKPDFDIDAKKNPGGDGVIIFVGIATPRRRGGTLFP
jgi:streptogramin lyase